MNILLVRLDHAGDVVLTVPPAAARLRGAMPDCCIDVLTTCTGESLLRDDPHINRIIAWDAPWSVPAPGLRYVPRITFIWRLSRFMRMCLRGELGRYDAIVYLSFSPWERVLTRLMSPRRLGFSGPYTRRAHRLSERLLSERLPFDESKHITENCHDLLSLLEPRGDRRTPRLYLDEQTKATAAERLREVTGNDDDIVLIHPGSPRSFKSWPHQHFIHVAEELADRGGVTCIIVSSEHEQAQFATQGYSAHPGVRYLVTTDLHEFAALASNARLVIANDGGPCHIAAAAGTSLIAIFGPTDEAIYGPVGPGVVVVRKPHAAAPCSTPWRVTRPCCEGGACLKGLSASRVAAEAIRILGDAAGQALPSAKQDTTLVIQP